MNGEMMKQIAEVLALVGIVAAIANIVAFALIRPHLQGSQAKPALVSWGYTGVGLALGVLGYWIARGLFKEAWTFAEGVAPLVIVLGVASWGYGSVADWVEARSAKNVPWFVPLVASAALGLTAGAAGLT